MGYDGAPEPMPYPGKTPPPDPFRRRRAARSRRARSMFFDVTDAASIVYGLHLAIDNLGGLMHWLGLALVWIAVLNLAWADR